MLSVAHPGLLPIPGLPELAASPDGIVVCEPRSSGFPERFVVEYRNPLSLIDRELTVDAAIEAVPRIPNFPLTKAEDGSYSVKRSHHFYYQIQGVLAATGTTTGYLVIRGHQSMAVARVSFDTDFFDTMVHKLRQFYFGAILPELACPLYRGLREHVRADLVDWDWSAL